MRICMYDPMTNTTCPFCVKDGGSDAILRANTALQGGVDAAHDTMDNYTPLLVKPPY